MFIAHTGYLELFNLVVKHILPGMGLFFYFVLHFNCKFAALKIKKTSHRGEVASEVMERLSAVAFGRLSQFCLPDELLSCTKEMAKRHC